MRAITNLMINDFKLKKLGYDFMGFSFKRKEQLSFHHLIVKIAKNYIFLVRVIYIGMVQY